MHIKIAPEKIMMAAIVLLAAVLVAVKLTNSRNAHKSFTGEGSMDDKYVEERLRMVEIQIKKRGVRDPDVLKAMEIVPRHLFVPPDQVVAAYDDTPLSIGYSQTISQPYIVALMTEILTLRPEDRVLEIGTGSGYQAAVLSVLVREVYSIEIVEPLGLSAAERLKNLGYTNVEVKIGDGYLGWPEKEPFDGIIVTAAPETIPQALIDQLADGGRLVIPVGKYFQELILVEKRDGKVKKKSIASVRFVPMVSDKEE